MFLLKVKFLEVFPLLGDRPSWVFRIRAYGCIGKLGVDHAAEVT